ncbi:hypothetical protein B0T22DRAFT_509148 [Podospora appendiculata]|uniref:Quinone oxidoreductase n=1 Tax=Podospora appendiculata TaxID=314037 RepID=A0AAE0XLM8_9PEZI|nr:hypothetical protein B0T22DRAFT_509148 [Podospora appendiculata]
MMKQAQISAWGEAPKCIQVPTPPLPTPTTTGGRDEIVQIRVLATGLHMHVRSRASGTHYSSTALPYIPGVDGVGRTVPDGALVFFAVLRRPQGGSFTEIINVPRGSTCPVPSEGGDPVQVAGLVNPVMASWMAFASRLDMGRLPAGFTVVLLGVTTLSGRVAVDVARVFGAGTVVGVGRDEGRMKAVGVDEVVLLKEGGKGEATDWGGAVDADVVLDFLYGDAALGLLMHLKGEKPVQYVQIGTLAGGSVELPGALLRSRDITMRGSGRGSWEMRDFAREAPGIVGAIASRKIRKQGFREVKLEDVEAAWGVEGGERIVVVP